MRKPDFYFVNLKEDSSWEIARWTDTHLWVMAGIYFPHPFFKIGDRVSMPDEIIESDLIKFAMWVTGDDEETVRQLYKDWKENN